MALEVTRRFYEDLIAAYSQPTQARYSLDAESVLQALRSGVTAGVGELVQLGMSLWRRRKDILAFLMWVQWPGGGSQRQVGASAGYCVGIS